MKMRVIKYSCVAQQVAHLTVNQSVVGSSPTAGAIRLGFSTFNKVYKQKKQVLSVITDFVSFNYHWRCRGLYKPDDMWLAKNAI